MMMVFLFNESSFKNAGGCVCLQARQYFKVTHDAIRATGSQHLILGVKFSGQFDEPVAQVKW